MALAQVHHYSMFTVTVIEQGHINDAPLSSAVFHSGCFALVNAPHLAVPVCMHVYTVYVCVCVSQHVLEALVL